MVSKRGQFFLLAAVIISAVVISLGISANWADVNREPENFYDFSYDVARESGAVIDYEIYTNVAGGKLEEFVDLLVADIRDRDPDANFLFIYGNSSNLVLKNYGTEDVVAGGEEVPGGGAVIESVIYLGAVGTTVTDYSYSFDEDVSIKVYENLDVDAVINLTISGYDFEFPVTENKQVIFVMQKEVDDESFVAVR